MSLPDWARFVLILFCRRKPRKLTEGEVERNISEDNPSDLTTPPDMAENISHNGHALCTDSTSGDTLTEQDVRPTIEADNTVSNVGEMDKPKPTPHIKSQSCCVCVETVTGEANIKSRFPYTCHHCHQANYCINCIKNWFLDACKNESKMPPKCCYAIPLGTVTNLLTPQEIELFKAKHEEWSTSDRLYCPVPSCSAFIPPRLYTERKTGNATPPAEPERGNGTDPNSTSLLTALRPIVACPDCHTNICTTCRSYLHSGECPNTDIDPDLAAILEKWKIKRCPKCRTGVRKMYGCSHVECHCGAHFCYGCLEPFTECDGQCEEAEEDDYPDEGDLDEDDLDGRAGFYDGDGRELGGEPRDNFADIWGCIHNWTLAKRESATVMLHTQQPTCHNCFQEVQFADEVTKSPKSYHKEQPSEVMDGEDVVMSGTDEAQVQIEKQKWKCYCGHQTCATCPREPLFARAFDTSWKWRCACGKTCYRCDRPAAKTATNIDLTVGWECVCGKIICGACKENGSE